MNKVEQLTATADLVLDYNVSLEANEILSMLNRYLKNQCQIVIYDESKKLFYMKSIDSYFLIANITYLGNPHPLYKKRLIVKDWFKKYYKSYKKVQNIKLIGIYTYDDMSIFVDFDIEKIMKNVVHNSSAHVNTNDLYQALKNGTFEKIDKYGNKIITIRGANFYKYLTKGETFKSPILKLISKFNENFPFGRWIIADKAIEEMRDANFSKWKEAEWAGWLLEKRFSDFIIKQKCNSVMSYNGIGSARQLDLYFPKEDFYGDLKASSIEQKVCILNDQEMMIDAILMNDKIWYIIYEHHTQRDIYYDNEMAIKRMNLIGNTYKKGDKISYSNRMKHSVNFSKRMVLEFNRINYRNILKHFNQGKFADGSDRKPKFSIDKKEVQEMIQKNELDNFLIYSYTYSE